MSTGSSLAHAPPAVRRIGFDPVRDGIGPDDCHPPRGRNDAVDHDPGNDHVGSLFGLDEILAVDRGDWPPGQVDCHQPLGFSLDLQTRDSELCKAGLPLIGRHCDPGRPGRSQRERGGPLNPVRIAVSVQNEEFHRSTRLTDLDGKNAFADRLGAPAA